MLTPGSSSIAPTIDGGGRMVLVSRADKGQPGSPFKRLYAAARRGRTAWRAVFLPWSARPDRDAAWYEAQQADVLHRTGSLDELHEQYPATDAEALLPRRFLFCLFLPFSAFSKVRHRSESREV